MLISLYEGKRVHVSPNQPFNKMHIRRVKRNNEHECILGPVIRIEHQELEVVGVILSAVITYN